jgi:hypothetical protein
VTVPAGFDTWFERCVQRDPARRFPDAQHALAGLAAWEAAAGAPISHGPGLVSSRRVTWSGEAVMAPGDTSVAPPPAWATSDAQRSLPHPTGEGTFRPLVDHDTRRPSAAPTKSLLIAGGAAVALGAGALVLVAGIGAALYFTDYLPGFDAPATSATPVASSNQSPSPSPSPSPSEAEIPSAAAPSKSTGASPVSASPATPTKPSAATAPAPAAPTPTASSTAPVEGPTPAQVGGFRALVANCWQNNEGPNAPAPVTVSITLRVDGNGSVRSVRIDNASAYPGLRMCTVNSGTMYRGFRPPPPTWTTTTFSVTLPAAKK